MTTVSSTERPSTLTERLDPRNWSLVAKLAVVGLVPTVLALTIGAFRVVDQANVAEQLGHGTALVDVHRKIETLTGALQAERNAGVTFVAGNRAGDRGAVDRAQAATDQALQEATAQLDLAEPEAPQLGTARRQAEATLGQLPVIRSQVATPPTSATDVTVRYTSVVQRTLALDRAVVGRLQTADTSSLATALAAGLNAREALEMERTVVNAGIAAGRLDETQRIQLTGAEAAFQTAAGDFQASAASAAPGSISIYIAGPTLDERNTLRDQALGTPDGARIAVDPAAWNTALDQSVRNATESIDQAEQSLVGTRAAAAEEAGNTAGLNSVLLMLTLLLTVGIILLLGRQMVRSLRLLRSSALDVAERKLPAAVASVRSGQVPNALVEPVPLDSRDEIGEVARAFDTVHGQAIRLAADQAALQQNVNSMFVNLSRRSQALVERQLQLIEQLESNEQDPDQLSNLFQLDHLATRMRRNSENLLVLAGTDLAKRNVAPVPVVDVLRAAVSEVEQYQRVVVQTPPNSTIAGRAANDLVHLLAELLDNATNFSPPDSQVIMSTTRTADESLLIEISDRGVGMTDGELVDANQRLSGPAEVDVSASRRMGLFVVGRLAARHRVGVRLASGAAGGGSGGLSASVTVPPHLVPSAPQPEQRPDGGAPQPALTAPAAVGAAGAATALGSGGAGTNGSARSGSLPSLVVGSDGPSAPTSDAGVTVTGGARNGSSAALPTRKPGSSLRPKPAEDSDSADAADGHGANGFAPGGLQAFAPSRDAGGDTDRDDRTPGDFFTPAGSGPSTGGSPAGGTGGRGPGGFPPQGPDRAQGRPSAFDEGFDDDAPGIDDGTGSGDVLEPEGAATTEAPDAADRDTTSEQPTGRAGTAEALGLGLVGTTAARPDREMDETVVLDAATDDGPPPADAADTADRTGAPAPGADPFTDADEHVTDRETEDEERRKPASGAGTAAAGAAAAGLAAAAGAAAFRRTPSPDHDETPADTAAPDAAAERDRTGAGSGRTGTADRSADEDADRAGSLRSGTDRAIPGAAAGERTAGTAGDGRDSDGTDTESDFGSGARTGSAASPAAAAGPAATADEETTVIDGGPASDATTAGADTAEPRIAEPGTAESGTAEPGAQEPGTHESRTHESGAHESGAQESGAHESGTQESGAAGSRTDEPGTTDSGDTESGAAESRAAESGTRGSSTNGSDTAGSDTARSDTTGSDETGSGRTIGGSTGAAAAGVAGAAAAGIAGAAGARTGRTADEETDARSDPRRDDSRPDGSGRDNTGRDSSGRDRTQQPGPTPNGTADTASFPAIRPPHREPMGGPPGSRPGPSRRPVMPGGRGPGRPPVPGRGPGAVPQGPGHPGPGRPGFPQRPGPGQAGRPAPGGPNGAPAQPGGPGGPGALPKRQAPARGPGGGDTGQFILPGPQGAAPDELFAPAVPVEGDRGQLRRPGALESARAHTQDDDMNQTTPIFDDIASAWFRSNRSVPVRWQDGSAAQAGPPPAPAAPSGPEQAPSAPSPAAPGEAGFASPADDLWRQAQEVVDDSDERADDLTSAGLPKRRPRARLLPGSAAGSTVLSPSQAGESRSAESVRGRLASYQQGVRQGRESAAGRRGSRTTADSAPEASADRQNSSDPEEHQ